MKQKILVFPAIEVASTAVFLQPFRGQLDLSGENHTLFLSLTANHFSPASLEAALDFLEQEAWILPSGTDRSWQVHPQLKLILSVSPTAEAVHYQYFNELSHRWVEQIETGENLGMEEDFPIRQADNLEKAVMTAMAQGFSIENPISALDTSDRHRGKHQCRIDRTLRIVEVFSSYSGLGPNFDYIASLDILADANQQEGQLGKAAEYHEKIAVLTAQQEDRLLQLAHFHALVNLLNILREQQQWQRGNTILKTLENLSIASSEPALQANLYTTIGLWHKAQHDLEIAQTYLGRAYNLTSEAYRKGMLLVNLAALADDAGQTEKALRLNFDALEIFKNFATQAPLGSLYSNIGLLYEQKQDLPEAVRFTKMALEWSLARGDWWKSGECYQNLGNFFLSRRQLEQAEEFYRRALETYQKASHSIAIGEAYQNLGEVKRLQGYFDESIQLAQIAIGIFAKHQDAQREADARLNLGSSLMQSEQLQSAWDNWSLAEQLLMRLGNRKGLGLIARNRAEWSRRTNAPATGEPYLKTAADMFGQVKAESEASELIAYANLFANLTGNRAILDELAIILNRYFDEGTMHQLLKNAATIYQRMA